MYVVTSENYIGEKKGYNTLLRDFIFVLFDYWGLSFGDKSRICKVAKKKKKS